MRRNKDTLGCCIFLLIAVAIVLYCAGRITYGFGRAEGYKQGQEDKISRAACMKYMVFEDRK